MKELSSCKCNGWQASIRVLNGCIDMSRVHGYAYAGLPFVYCPWCGKKRVKVKGKNEDLRQVADEIKVAASKWVFTPLPPRKDTVRAIKAYEDSHPMIDLMGQVPGRPKKVSKEVKTYIESEKRRLGPYGRRPKIKFVPKKEKI